MCVKHVNAKINACLQLMPGKWVTAKNNTWVFNGGNIVCNKNNPHKFGWENL